MTTPLLPQPQPYGRRYRLGQPRATIDLAPDGRWTRAATPTPLAGWRRVSAHETLNFMADKYGRRDPSKR